MLPKVNENDCTHIVVPNSIKLGWAESMYVFCAGSESSRDTAEKLLEMKILPLHQLDNHTLPSNFEYTNETKIIKL